MKVEAVPQAAGESDRQPQQETTPDRPPAATPAQFAIARQDQFALRPKATARPAELELIKRLIKAIKGL